jgi:23S rRNA (pseudouridine1915-N3)-methyltransferase
VRYFVVAVGKSRPPFHDDLQHYSKLLSRYARVDVIEVADDRTRPRPSRAGSRNAARPAAMSAS